MGLVVRPHVRRIHLQSMQSLSGPSMSHPLHGLQRLGEHSNANQAYKECRHRKRIRHEGSYEILHGTIIWDAEPLSTISGKIKKGDPKTALFRKLHQFKKVYRRHPRAAAAYLHDAVRSSSPILPRTRHGQPERPCASGRPRPLCALPARAATHAGR